MISFGVISTPAGEAFSHNLRPVRGFQATEPFRAESHDVVAHHDSGAGTTQKSRFSGPQLQHRELIALLETDVPLVPAQVDALHRGRERGAGKVHAEIMDRRALHREEPLPMDREMPCAIPRQIPGPKGFSRGGAVNMQLPGERGDIGPQATNPNERAGVPAISDSTSCFQRSLPVARSKAASTHSRGNKATSRSFPAHPIRTGARVKAPLRFRGEPPASTFPKGRAIRAAHRDHPIPRAEKR